MLAITFSRPPQRAHCSISIPKLRIGRERVLRLRDADRQIAEAVLLRTAVSATTSLA
jgi:hypothetical protein